MFSVLYSMGRSGLTATLIFVCFAVILLQGCGLTKGRANVTLLTSNTKAWCIAQGEAATSALAWTSDISSPVAPNSTFIGVTGLECNFMAHEKCKGWEGLQDWTVFSSLQQPMPPLLDYRWDELPIISTNGKTEFLRKNNVQLPQEQTSYTIKLSVTAASDAYIVLCEGENPFKSGCYWIMIGGWSLKNPKSVIRRCPTGVNSDGYPQGDCKYILAEHMGQLLSTRKWLHVAINLKKYSQYLNVSVFTGNRIILEYNDINPLLVKFLNVRSGQDVHANFKIQNYTFIASGKNTVLKSPLFKPQSSQLCLSVLYHSKFRALDIGLHLEYADSSIDYTTKTPIKYLDWSQGSWREERINHSLNQGWEKGIRIIFDVKTTKFNLFSIGSVRECNLQGDTRISSVELSSSNRANLTCHPLMYQYENEKLTLTKPDPSFTGCGPDCPVSCDKFPIYSGSCGGFTLCQPTGKNSSTCFCSLGYRGEDCWTRKETTPSRVRSLASTPVDSNTLMVSWMIPESPKEGIKHYAVIYQHYNYSACEYPTTNETSKGSLTTEHTTVKLKNLVPYSNYLIRVIGFTVVYGEEAQLYASTLETAIPQTRPEQSRHSEDIYPSRAILYWEPPKDCTSIKGPIDSYEINIMGVSPWAKSFQKSFSKAKNGKHIVFDDLIPYTEYIVTVFVSRPSGVINEELPYKINFKTLPTKPGRVINATAYSFGDSWVYLRWDPPYPPHGELKSYKVEYWQHNSDYSSSFRTKTFDKNSVCGFWEEKICAELEKGVELKKNAEYYFKISAQNNEQHGYGDSVTLIARTQEKAPGPPINLKIANLSPRTMHLTWQHPDFENGKIKVFEIQVILLSSELRRRGDQKDISETLNVTKSTKNYSFEVTDLLPSTVYRVSVRGKTNAVGEEAILEKVTTSLSTPIFKSELNVVNNSVTETSFKVSIPPADPFLTKKGTLFLIVTSGIEEIPEQEAGFLFKSENFKKEDLLAEANIREDRHSWVAAKIMPEDEVINFTVGDASSQFNGSQNEDYRNRPLTPGVYYQVTLVAVNQLNNDSKFSAVKLRRLVQTYASFSFEKTNGIGLEWCAFLLLLVIPIAAFFIIRRFRRREIIEEELYQDAIPESQDYEVIEPELPKRTKKNTRCATFL